MSTRAQEKFIRTMQARIKRGVTSGRTVTPKRTEMLSAQYQSTYDPYTAAGSVMSTYQYICRLYGFWPMNTALGLTIHDHSPLAKHMTATATGLAMGIPSAGGGYIPYLYTDGSNGYLYRADSDFNFAGLSFGFGCWVKITTLEAVNFIGKFGASGNYGYTINNSVNDKFVVTVSGDGTAMTSQAATPTNSADTWYFVAGLYTPSTSLKIMVNGVWYENTTSIPAAVYATSAQLQIGANTSLGQYLDGYITLAWVAAYSPKDYYIRHLYEVSRPLFGV